MKKVYLSPYAVGPNSFNLIGDSPQISALRSCILYWDSVTVPEPMPGSLPELSVVLDYLSTTGVVDRYNVQNENIYDDNSRELFAKDFLRRTQIITSDTENQWAILAPAGDTQSLTSYFKAILNSSPDSGHEARTTVLELAFRNALPSPPEDTAFEDILEFKAQRTDQLAELNRAIDYLAVALSGAETLDDALRVGRDTIQVALSDLDRVMSEAWARRILSTLRANIGAIAVAAGAGALAAPSLGLPMLVGAAASAAAPPIVQVVIDSVVSSRVMPERAAPYLFAFEVGRTFNR